MVKVKESMKDMINEPKQNIETILSMKARGVFLKYIDFIHFPFYRNMEINSRINFEFPLTVIVGQNGCGKSSLLHAVSGMPKWKTPSKFWFDTKVDPIEYYDDEKRRHSFWYQFTQDGIKNQVIKARIKRNDNPNYWETSRPLVWAGMKPFKKSDKERYKPIEKNVIYLDFRSELSAFDKFFYFGFLGKDEAENKQEYIRNHSEDLLNAFKGNIIKSKKNKELNKPVVSLDDDELVFISYILGRNYVEARSVFHSIYKNPGYSVLFKSSHANYSEAFAGSGEMAVVRLVQEVLKAPDYSLIILDEPEVSLHPGAQERLTNFLLEEIKRKKHQVVITSHSPSIIKKLPKEAIKVLYQNPSNGRFLVKENLLPEEAFFHIEFSNDDKKRIHFEDKLAKEIFSQVLKNVGTEKESLFKLIYNPGGCSVLNSEFITVYCREDNCKDFVVFDGDQQNAEPVDWRTLSTADLTIEKLKDKIKKLTNCEIRFSVDGGDNGENQAQKIELYKKYLDFYRVKVFFLPLKIPEDIIWNEDYANIITNNEIESKWDSLANTKEKFAKLCDYLFGEENNSSEKIFNTQQIFIRNWIKGKDNNYNAIVEIINRLSDI
jgi:predicted ATPase